MTVAAPEEPHGNGKQESPEEEDGAEFGEEEKKGDKSVGNVSITVHESVVEPRGDGRGRRVQLGFVFFGDFEIHGREIHAMFEVLLFSFHLLDFAAHTSDFLFDFEDVADFSGALGEDGLETLLGFAGIFETGDEVGVLLGDFFAVLIFVFDVAERFEFGESGGELRRGDAERRFGGAGGTLRSAGAKISGVAVVADKDGIERGPRGVEIFRYESKRYAPRDHGSRRNECL